MGLGTEWMERFTLREMDAVALRRHERWRAEMELHDDFSARIVSAWAGKPYTDLRILPRERDQETGGDPHANDISWEEIGLVGPFARERKVDEVN